MLVSMRSVRDRQTPHRAHRDLPFEPSVRLDMAGGRLLVVVERTPLLTEHCKSKSGAITEMLVLQKHNTLSRICTTLGRGYHAAGTTRKKEPRAIPLVLSCSSPLQATHTATATHTEPHSLCASSPRFYLMWPAVSASLGSEEIFVGQALEEQSQQLRLAAAADVQLDGYLNTCQCHL